MSQKHMCCICLSKFTCYTKRCTGKYITKCDTCLIAIPLRYYEDLPP